MSSTEQLEAAEAKMNAAHSALLKYVEERSTLDRDHYHRLAAKFKKAQAEFMRALEGEQS